MAALSHDGSTRGDVHGQRPSSVVPPRDMLPPSCSCGRRGHTGTAPVPQESKCAQFVCGNRRRASWVLDEFAPCRGQPAVRLGGRIGVDARLRCHSPPRFARSSFRRFSLTPRTCGARDARGSGRLLAPSTTPVGHGAHAERFEELASCSSEGSCLMAPFDPAVLRSPRALSRDVRSRREGPGSAFVAKSNRGVAVLTGGARPRRLTASMGSDVAPSQHPRAAGSRFLGRRVDPQTEIGRRACGERVAKPAPSFTNQLNPRSTHR